MWHAEKYPSPRKPGALLLTLVLLALALTGATLAYLITHTDPVPNRFTPAHVSCTVTEDFDGTTKKNVNVTNTGDIDAYLRVKLVTYRVNDDGQHIGGSSHPRLHPRRRLGKVWRLLLLHLPVAPGQQPETPLIDSLTLTGSYYDADGGKQALEIMAEAIQSAPEEGGAGLGRHHHAGPSGPVSVRRERHETKKHLFSGVDAADAPVLSLRRLRRYRLRHL